MKVRSFPGRIADNERDYLCQRLCTNPFAYRLEDVDLRRIERVSSENLLHRLLLQCQEILKCSSLRE